jgi:nucleoside-diphosphate-sugar epimerase
MGAILVTGSSGFVGKALVLRLRAAGHRVCEFDREHGDLTLPGALDAFLEQGITHLFHLAARTFVPESWQDPQGFYQTNVMGTVTALEFCRRAGAAMTFMSSYLYGEPLYLPVDEKHPLRARNPYGQSKLMAESACGFYAQELGLPLTVFRPFNIYGPGQNRQFLIPEILQQVADPAARTITVKDLRPRRDFLFVEDLVDALVLSLQGPRGIYNVAGGASWSVEEIIRLAQEAGGTAKEVRSLEEVRPNEILELYGDIARIKHEFSWSPRTSMIEGLRRCLAPAAPPR